MATSSGPRPKTYDVLGLGGPLVDRLIHVSEEFLESAPGLKGGAHEIDLGTLNRLIQESGSSEELVPGGAAANTIKGLNALGHSCALLGAAGPDGYAQAYRQHLAQLGIESLLIERRSPTGQVLCLIDPSGERSMRPFPSASVEIGPEDVTEHHMQPARLMVIEAFAFRSGPLMMHCLRLAKRCGVEVALGAASFEIVQEHREAFEEAFDSGAIDIFFANESEAEALTGFCGERAVQDLAERCATAVVTLGKRGCLVKSGSCEEACAVDTRKVRDSTGAGDLFAAGYLHGHLEGWSIADSARAACLLGAEVTQHIGPELPDDVWERVRQSLKQTSLRSR